jgi:hypothetical protein
MAVTRRTWIPVLAAALAAMLWYLRDPAWLSDQTTGLRKWERTADGSVHRWSGGHASFFVPAEARQLRIPVATTFDSREPGGDRPMMVAFTIDDVRAARVLLEDTAVHEVVLQMPSPGSRRVRRIDVRTSVTREGNHGVKVGAVSMTPDGVNWRPCCLVPR